MTTSADKKKLTPLVEKKPIERIVDTLAELSKLGFQQAFDVTRMFCMGVHTPYIIAYVEGCLDALESRQEKLDATKRHLTDLLADLESVEREFKETD